MCVPTPKLKCLLKNDSQSKSNLIIDKINEAFICSSNESTSVMAQCSQIKSGLLNRAYKALCDLPRLACSHFALYAPAKQN